MLTKDVGAYARGTGSTAAGTAQAKTLLGGKQLLARTDVLEDGSGLGLHNRLTAESLVRVLSAADAEPDWDRPSSMRWRRWARNAEATVHRHRPAGTLSMPRPATSAALQPWQASSTAPESRATHSPS